MTFKVFVNVFTREYIIATDKEVFYSSFDDVDEWNIIEFDKTYKVHFHYDENFTVSIYEDNEAYISEKVELILLYNEKSFQEITDKYTFDTHTIKNEYLGENYFKYSTI